jgi:hypothetical protein
MTVKAVVPIETVRARAFNIPTDKPEADGTIAWDSTTLVVVEMSGGGMVGLGYTYSGGSIVNLIKGELSKTIIGLDVFDSQAVWLAMQRAVRNLGREGLAATAISAVDVAIYHLISPRRLYGRRGLRFVGCRAPRGWSAPVSPTAAHVRQAHPEAADSRVQNVARREQNQPVCRNDGQSFVGMED